MSFFAAIDTNVVLSALLSKYSDAATVKVMDAVFEGRIIPLYHPDILEEYRDVLHRDRFHLEENAVNIVIADIARLGIKIEPSHIEETFNDPDDVVFYEVVMDKRKTDEAFLVTGNKRHFPCKTFIVTPAEMLALMEGVGED